MNQKPKYRGPSTNSYAAAYAYDFGFVSRELKATRKDLTSSNLRFVRQRGETRIWSRAYTLPLKDSAKYMVNYFKKHFNSYYKKHPIKQ